MRGYSFFTRKGERGGRGGEEKNSIARIISDCLMSECLNVEPELLEI